MSKAKSKTKFAAFILTHGRPDNVKTYDSLKKSGYTGRIVILIDNEDKKQDEYRAKFGDQVQVFDKAAIASEFDEADNFGDRRAIVYARNACFKVAERLGIDWFIQLDDDYTEFSFRYDSRLDYTFKRILNLDLIFKILVKFVKATGAKTICMAQGGDYIGGSDSSLAKNVILKRKAMNTFICKTSDPIGFVGRINEDVNTYCWRGGLGDLFFTMNQLSINQLQTQSNSGGMTELYLDSGTYVKSFYSVMFCPSSVVVGEMPSKFRRLHHRIDWNKTVPKIISEDWKKL